MADFVGPAYGDRISEYYDRFEAFHRPVKPVVDFLLDRLPPEGRLLEVGVGSGRVACSLANQCAAELWGVDVSQKMLDILRRECANVHPLELDITVARPGEGTFDGVYCIYNTLFMLGPPHKQDAALRIIRGCTSDGGRLVLEHFQPLADAYYTEDSFTLQPLHMNAEGVLLRVEHVSAAKRLIEAQDIYLTHGQVALAPFSFSYRSVDEVDSSARDAGWEPTERYAGWTGAPFQASSPNIISVYEAQ